MKTTVRGLAAAGTTALVLTLAPAAQADPGYRYWGYSQLTDDAWVASQKGADNVVPKDGTVEGWRYQTTAADTRAPRDVLTFDEVCGSTDAEQGKKRVAVVVDPGRDADHGKDAGEAPAPSAECAVVDEKATGTEVLNAVADVTSDKGMITAIDGFPASTADAQVKEVPEEALAKDDTITIEPAAAQVAADTSDDTTRWIGLGAAALLLTALLGWLLGRNRKNGADTVITREHAQPHGATRVGAVRDGDVQRDDVRDVTVTETRTRRDDV